MHVYVCLLGAYVCVCMWVEYSIIRVGEGDPRDICMCMDGSVSSGTVKVVVRVVAPVVMAVVVIVRHA